MRTFALIPLIALTLVGCGLFSIEPEEIDIADGDEVGVEDVGDSTGDSTGDEAGTGGESSTDGSDTTSTDPTTGDSADSSDSSSDSATDTSGDSTGTGTDTGGACEPSGEEPVCLACVMDTCCDELLACELDADCACVLGCIGNDGTLDACLAECQALGDPLAALTSCANINCVVECG